MQNKKINSRNDWNGAPHGRVSRPWKKQTALFQGLETLIGFFPNDWKSQGHRVPGLGKNHAEFSKPWEKPAARGGSRFVVAGKQPRLGGRTGSRSRQRLRSAGGARSGAAARAGAKAWPCFYGIEMLLEGKLYPVRVLPRGN